MIRIKANWAVYCELQVFSMYNTNFDISIVSLPPALDTLANSELVRGSGGSNSRFRALPRRHA